MYKTTPFAHQLSELDVSRDLPVRGIFWEQGTGKTKTTLDTAAHLYRAGKIDAVLCVAPNNVHTNWITDEIPAHLPDDIPVRTHEYKTKSAEAKWHKADLERLLSFKGLAFLAMSYDAFMTGTGRQTAEKFLARRKVFYVLDESQRIKTPGAKRTKAIVASGRRATYKRILSGTPITRSPFDVYSQIKFLDEDFWKRHDFASYEPFKVFFGNWEQRIGGGGQRFSQIVSYKNLDVLAKYVAEIAGRVTKDQVLDLPPKVYQRRYFDLTPEQQGAYSTLRDEFLLFLDEQTTVSAPLAVTRLLRLQQITCGYVPVDQVGPQEPGSMQRFDPNPRLAALEEVLEDLEGQAIIFARFRADIDQIMALLGKDAVRFDGATDDEQRLAARQLFQAGHKRFFVANPAAAGVGLTLHAASTVVYYSNSFNLEDRIQSEDRAHRIGQNKTVTYIDLVAKGSVDSHIVRALRTKQNLAALVTGDSAKEWI